MGESLLQRAARLVGPDELNKLLAENGQLDTIKFNWHALARPEQLPPKGDWRTWLILAGRGWGKTRTGAEWVREKAEANPNIRIALVAPTAGDARDVMIEGESGIMNICPPDKRPVYEPSKRRVTWPNGAQATAYSADEPERLRGPQHHCAWADELGAWFYIQNAFDMLQMGLRLGDLPQLAITTTPKPFKLLRELMLSRSTVLTKGSTFDNAPNLAEQFIQAVKEKYDGTRLGRQELYAEILDDNPGALWQPSNIDLYRVKECPDLVRIVVAVDPAVTSHEGSDETGIVVAGKDLDGNGYILADKTCRLSPDGWARVAVDSFHGYAADRIVAEVNNGGDLVESTIRTVDPLISFDPVRASRGKAKRAEPVAALYEQGKIHHVGIFKELEDQMCRFTPEMKDSPDRADALVWALTHLFLGESQASFGSLGFKSPKRFGVDSSSGTDPETDDDSPEIIILPYRSPLM